MRCDEVILTPDTENSDINQSLDVSGYKITKHAVAMVPIAYSNTQDDPALDSVKDQNGSLITTEILTNVEIVRDCYGIYFKCFIALFATIIWVLVMLYVASIHEVRTLDMIPGAFFGAV